jgi:peptidoglycan/xylan/chitin deacetylase (PgdA/CDA1 family)/GT2 family glycosyltransferase
MNYYKSVPKISIVICTYKRYELTHQVVKSFCSQTSPKDNFEVILVENDTGRNDKIRQIVEEAEKMIFISYIFETSIGLSYARNTGGKAARADYVGYIDDDALAPDNYIEKYLDIIDRLKPDIIGGPIYAMYNSKKPKWYREDYGSNTNNGLSGYFKSTQYISGTSMGFRKSLLDEMGWFDTDLGMTGNKIWYGEETMVQIKAWRKHKDLKVWFEQDLYIHHLIHYQKMKLSGKIKRSYNAGRSASYLWIPDERIYDVQKRSPYILSKTIIRFIVFGIPGILFHDRIKYPYWQNYVFEILAPYFASIGQEIQFTADLVNRYINYTRHRLPGRNLYHKIKRVLFYYMQNYTRTLKYCNNSFVKEIALSFDDGPHPVVTPQVLAVLEKYNIRANFFVSGVAAEQNLLLLKEISKKGHLIGNHGYEHVHLDTLLPDLMTSQLTKTDMLVESETGIRNMRFYRPPYGKLNDFYLSWIRKSKKFNVLWSLDSYDYRDDYTSDLIIKDLMKDIHNGDIVLFHDTRELILNVLDTIIPVLINHGFQFVRLDEKFHR